MRIIKLAVAQYSCSNDRQHNLNQGLELISRAAEMGADLVVLPELFEYPYFCHTQNPDYFQYAESIPSPTTKELAHLARAHRMIIATTIFEKRAAGIYHNTAVVMDKNGELAGVYRKMHIPQEPHYHEKFYFTPGEEGFHVIETESVKIGVLICWDQWFPEAARLLALNGAELLVAPTAIGWDRQESEKQQTQQYAAWTDIQRSHAIANALPVAVSNRVGVEASNLPQTEFWGGSFIVGPQGELLVQAEKDVGITVAEIDLDQTTTLRQTWPFMRDRRIDCYQGLLQRFNT